MDSRAMLTQGFVTSHAMQYTSFIAPKPLYTCIHRNMSRYEAYGGAPSVLACNPRVQSLPKRCTCVMAAESSP